MNKITKKSILALCLTAALSACLPMEDDDDDLGGKDTNSRDYNVKVIDGYLSKADVVPDMNGNFSIDSGMESDISLMYRTNDEGVSSLYYAQFKHNLIANIGAGRTSDSDKVGMAARSYQLIAPAKTNFITPFTTLAMLDNSTTQALAAELGINADIISGDYISYKSTHHVEDAKKAHLIARSLAGGVILTYAFRDQGESTCN